MTQVTSRFQPFSLARLAGTTLAVSALAIAALQPSPALAVDRPVSIATVDINQILNELDEAKELKEELDEATESATEEIERRKERLTKKQKDLQKRKVAADSEEAERFRKSFKDFERYVKDTQEKLRKDFLKTNNALAEKVMEEIRDYAEENRIDLVLEKSSQGRSAVLYGANAADITGEILDEMN